MSHAEGTYLGSVRDLATLKARCVVDPGADGCWHLRSADGKPMPDGDQAAKVWVHGRGAMTAARFALECSTGQPLPRGVDAMRTCQSYDCVRPRHLRAMTKTEKGAFLSERGRFSTQAKRACARAAGMTNAKLTPELRVWLIESTQSGAAAAHGLGISQGRANALRCEARKRAGGAPRSVFEFRGLPPIITAPERASSGVHA